MPLASCGTVVMGVGTTLWIGLGQWKPTGMTGSDVLKKIKCPRWSLCVFGARFTSIGARGFPGSRNITGQAREIGKGRSRDWKWRNRTRWARAIWVGLLLFSRGLVAYLPLRLCVLTQTEINLGANASNAAQTRLFDVPFRWLPLTENMMRAPYSQAPRRCFSSVS